MSGADPPAKGPAWFAASRAETRVTAVQALYQLEFGGRGAGAVIAEFLEHRLPEEERAGLVDETLFRTIVEGVVAQQNEIDRTAADALAAGWRLDRIDATARAILRAGVYELAFRLDIPARASVGAYVDVAAAFFDDGEELRFLNAALDGIARRVRSDEFTASE